MYDTPTSYYPKLPNSGLVNHFLHPRVYKEKCEEGEQTLDIKGKYCSRQPLPGRWGRAWFLPGPGSGVGETRGAYRSFLSLEQSIDRA